MREGLDQEKTLFVIGASAGGIEALERVLSSLPADFGAPIVIAQHLDPTTPSRLEEVLRPVSKLRLVSVSDGASLEPATVYLVPSGRHVEIQDGHLVTSTKMRQSRPQPSIDLLFETASEAYGDRLVAVILSGMGKDGSAGVRAVKEAGGTVIVQDPASAAYPALPSSIPPNHADLVAPPERIANLLVGFVTRKPIAEALFDEEVLRAFLTQLRARSGIDFTQYKTPTIVRRLSRLIAASRCANLAEYMRYLNAHPDAYERLIDAFLIKVTGFFRDPALFAYLREHVLPDVLEHARKTNGELRVWSAGCATGEEPYSIAILLNDLMGDNEDVHIRIFGTDLDSDSIVFARRGIYPSGAVSGMPPELVQRYFSKVNDSYQVKKSIRNLTIFGEYDLGQRAPFPRIDLILCRNVLIYFSKDLQQRALHLFAFSLREGGYLALGKSETATPLPQYFSAEYPALKIFRRYGERMTVPPPLFIPSKIRTARPPIPRPVPDHALVLRRPARETEHLSLGEKLGSFLLESSEGVVIVDRDYDIETINQAARSMLGVHGEAVGQDLIHLASTLPGGLLKNMLDSALRGEKRGEKCEVELRDPADDRVRSLQISCYPDKAGDKDGQVSGAILLIHDSTEEFKARHEAESENVRRGELSERLTKQNEELHARVRALSEANVELTGANNELRNANEHLLITAEEAEASAEEVETLNEEMQATSEELETLNEELQATVEELNTTNEELSARTIELERVSAERLEQLKRTDEERRMYEGAISEMPAAVAVVAPDGQIVCTSKAYRALTEEIKSLREVGQVWVEPDVRDASVRVVAIAFGERPATLIFITSA